MSDDDLVAFFMRHVVPVFFTFERGTDSHSAVVTAFVLSVADQWFLVTAGHCIEEIEELTTKGGHRIAKCYLIDSLGLGAKHRDLIPFSYQSVRPVHFNDDANFDYGFIALSPYYRELLEKNNVQSLNEEVWKHQPPSADFYMLLGIPGELVKVDSENVELSPILFRVKPLHERPDGFVETDMPLFYGYIDLGQAINSLGGTSGGPVFAFRQNEQGQLRYWLTALQSRWLPRSRYIVACPTRLLGDFLETVLKEAEAINRAA